MLYFPIEIQVRILVHLGLKDLNNVQLVCKKLYLLIKEEWFWKEALKERFEIADIGVGDFSTFRKCLGESSATAISELIGCNSFREYYRFKDRLLLKNEMFSHFSEAWEFRKEDDKSFRYCTLTTSSAPFEILGELKGVLAGSYRIKWKIRLERGNYNLKGTTFTATVKVHFTWD